MSESKVITLVPRVTTEALERAAWRLDTRKYPRHAEVLSIAIARRRVDERGQIQEFEARKRAA